MWIPCGNYVQPLVYPRWIWRDVCVGGSPPTLLDSSFPAPPAWLLPAGAAVPPLLQGRWLPRTHGPWKSPRSRRDGDACNLEARWSALPPAVTPALGGASRLAVGSSEEREERGAVTSLPPRLTDHPEGRHALSEGSSLVAPAWGAQESSVAVSRAPSGACECGFDRSPPQPRPRAWRWEQDAAGMARPSALLTLLASQDLLARDRKWGGRGYREPQTERGPGETPRW